MKNAPEKWKKYEILYRYGLTALEDIKKQIKRYSNNEINALYNDIKSDIFFQDGYESVYVIKLVPQILQPKMKTYVIQNMHQLDNAIIEITESADLATIVELWCCKTKLTDGRAIFGRLYINNGNGAEVSQYIEQVWANTARKIESVGFDDPYIAARRLWWGRTFRITSCNIKQIGFEQALLSFEEVLKQLESKRDNIELLTQDAEKKNVFSLSIEYKVIDGRVFIADWDSPDDKLLLRMIGG